VSAVVATDSGKSLPQVSALHEPSCGDADYRSPEAVFCCISLGIDIFKFAVVVALAEIDLYPKVHDNGVRSGVPIFRREKASSGNFKGLFQGGIKFVHL